MFRSSIFRTSLFRASVVLAFALSGALSASGQDGDDAERVQGGTRLALVEASAAYLRAAPDYESPLESQLLMGTPVTILEEQGYWRKVQAPDYCGWVDRLSLAEMDAENFARLQSLPRLVCTAEISHVFASPSLASERICDLVMGDEVFPAYTAKRRERRGFIQICLPSGKEGWVPAGDLTALSWLRKGGAPQITALARRFLGVPYLWGGCTPKGFDCSGLVQLCFRMNGYILPRNASQMALLGTPVDIADGDWGGLQEADLLFFGNRESGRVTHVAMYLGEGKIIHSSMTVRINSLDPSAPDAYENAHRLLFARRLLQ